MSGGGHHSSELYDEIISVQNLFLAWREFKRRKSWNEDVGIFAAELEEHIFSLHRALKTETYRHEGYTAFVRCDPKRRIIHKSSIRDRLLHYAVFRILYPLFEKTFIFESYSSRTGKGTYRGVERLTQLARKMSRNYTQSLFVLQCDIRTFFDSVDHEMLLNRLRQKINDSRVMALLSGVVGSFETAPGKGIPLGNVTSQLFSNVYLNPLDHFIKRRLRMKAYVRYADDFVILSSKCGVLKGLVSVVADFLRRQCLLELHPNKVTVTPFHRGADFLGFVSYPYYRVIRTTTKRRIFQKLTERKRHFERGLISDYSFRQSIQSYKGILSHCKGRKIKRKIKRVVGTHY